MSPYSPTPKRTPGTRGGRGRGGVQRQNPPAYNYNSYGDNYNTLARTPSERKVGNKNNGGKSNKNINSNVNNTNNNIHDNIHNNNNGDYKGGHPNHGLPHFSEDQEHVHYSHDPGLQASLSFEEREGRICILLCFLFSVFCFLFSSGVLFHIEWCIRLAALLFFYHIPQYH